MRYDLLHECGGLDLDDWLRGERDWSTLMEIIGQLSTYSRYHLARSSDVQLAREILEVYPEQEPPSGDGHPALADWSRIRGDIADVKDLLLQLIHIQGKSKKPPMFTPRPRTGMEIALAERSTNVLSEVTATLLGQNN